MVIIENRISIVTFEDFEHFFVYHFQISTVRKINMIVTGKFTDCDETRSQFVCQQWNILQPKSICSVNYSN